MMRDVAILTAAVVALHWGSSAGRAAEAGMAGSERPQTQAFLLKPFDPDSPPAGLQQAPVEEEKHRPAHRFHAQRVAAHPIRPAVAPAPIDPPADNVIEEPALSDQEELVSEIAERNGDRNFLMVDKLHGKIILFENDRPVFSGPALTGESLSDRLPPGAEKQAFSKLTSLDTKVTPAGRYTVSRGHDDDYGTVLDVNEIHGTDWGIAIHKVYLGTPSEHRDLRIISPSEDDKHITFGCINVTPDAIKFLLRELPQKGRTPLYILPEDQTRIADFFAPANS